MERLFGCPVSALNAMVKSFETRIKGEDDTKKALFHVVLPVATGALALYTLKKLRTYWLTEISPFVLRNEEIDLDRMDRNVAGRESSHSKRFCYHSFHIYNAHLLHYLLIVYLWYYQEALDVSKP